MKKASTILILLLAVASNSFGQSNQHYIIHVVNAANFKEPAVNLKDANNEATYNADLARHKDREVNVYRTTTPMGLGYTANYYQNEDNTIRHHSFSWTSPDIYDKADYCWSRDTLCVQLFNMDKKDKVYKGYGRGSSSSMITP